MPPLFPRQLRRRRLLTLSCASCRRPQDVLRIAVTVVPCLHSCAYGCLLAASARWPLHCQDEISPRRFTARSLPRVHRPGPRSVTRHSVPAMQRQARQGALEERESEVSSRPAPERRLATPRRSAGHSLWPDASCAPRISVNRQVRQGQVHNQPQPLPPRRRRGAHQKGRRRAPQPAVIRLRSRRPGPSSSHTARSRRPFPTPSPRGGADNPSVQI